MFADVLLLNGFKQSLTYKVPAFLLDKIGVGTLVRVPLRTATYLAYVIELRPDFYANFEIREIIDLGRFPDDARFAEFIGKISRFYFTPQLHFFQRIRSFLSDKKEAKPEVLPVGDLSQNKLEVQLTDEQSVVVEYVRPFIKTPDYKPTLVHGVTGSGKTEVYKALIKSCMDNNKSVLMLLPEVSLSTQFERLLCQQLPDVKIFGFHSATKISQRRALWDALLKNQPILIIGVHMPIMLPINNLGLIIIDEEHESGFVEKKHPRLNSKEVALWRASIYKIPILMGSATPSLTSLHNVQTHGWKLFKITKRFKGSFPLVTKVILSSQRDQKRKNFWVSRELDVAVRQCLERGEQAMIYLNRRGYSFFVQCKNCGFIFNCPHCSVSLTLHADSQLSTGILRCHYCNYSKTLPSSCPECSGSGKDFLKKGVGTQQAVNIFQELFPQARIARADLDTTSKQREWHKTVEQFEQGELDILIGTQTITKGYHFPGVTLVGVLWADVNLHMPFYNACESTLQQLIQVAGRAGRVQNHSRVIIQAVQDHKIFDFLSELDYIDFCKNESQIRREVFYPPFCRLAQVELRSESAQEIDFDAVIVADFLRKMAHDLSLDVQILGPALPAISKIQNVEIRQIFLKAKQFATIHKALGLIDSVQIKSRVFITVTQ
jgi:primosomal protein N' (replication factor Y)